MGLGLGLGLGEGLGLGDILDPAHQYVLLPQE